MRGRSLVLYDALADAKAELNEVLIGTEDAQHLTRLVRSGHDHHHALPHEFRSLKGGVNDGVVHLHIAGTNV